MSRAKAISMKLLKVSQKLGVTNQTILIRFFHERPRSAQALFCLSRFISSGSCLITIHITIHPGSAETLPGTPGLL